MYSVQNWWQWSGAEMDLECGTFGHDNNRRCFADLDIQETASQQVGQRREQG